MKTLLRIAFVALLFVVSLAIAQPGDANWSIPDVSQAFIESRIPSTLTVGEADD